MPDAPTSGEETRNRPVDFFMQSIFGVFSLFGAEDAKTVLMGEIDDNSAVFMVVPKDMMPRDAMREMAREFAEDMDMDEDRIREILTKNIEKSVGPLISGRTVVEGHEIQIPDRYIDAAINYYNKGMSAKTGKNVKEWIVKTYSGYLKDGS